MNAMTIFDNLNGRTEVPTHYVRAVSRPGDIRHLFELDLTLWLLYGSSQGPVLQDKAGHKFAKNLIYMRRMIEAERFSGNSFWVPKHGLNPFRRGSTFDLAGKLYVFTGERAMMMMPVNYINGKPFEHPCTLEWLFDFPPTATTWCLRCNRTWQLAPRLGDNEICEEAWGRNLVTNDPDPQTDIDGPHYLVYRRLDGIWKRSAVATSC